MKASPNYMYIATAVYSYCNCIGIGTVYKRTERLGNLFLEKLAKTAVPGIHVSNQLVPVHAYTQRVVAMTTSCKIDKQ